MLLGQSHDNYFEDSHEKMDLQKICKPENVKELYLYGV